jgi:hypothetical protein
MNKGELQMEKFINFINVLAWIAAIISTGFVAARIAAYYCYSELEKIRDKMNGVHTTFPITNGSIVAIICWAWIISGCLL